MSFSSRFSNEGKSPQDIDLATFSNYLEVRTTHLSIQWTIDWKAQVFGGTATLQMEVTKDHPLKEVVLDTSYLDVQNVQVDGQDTVRPLQPGNSIITPLND